MLPVRRPERVGYIGRKWAPTKTGAAATSTAEASTAEAGATDTPQQPVAEHMEAAVEDDSAYDVPEAQQEDGEIDEDDDIM